MTKLTVRKEALLDRLADAFGDQHFTLRSERRGKYIPRGIRIQWAAYPFEQEVAAALGDLLTEADRLDRLRLWTCGRVHADEIEAWKAHEGDDHLQYPDHGCGPDYDDEKILPVEVEEALRAAGETFESGCRPGDYIPCPTCGGGARIVQFHGRTGQFHPCPDCVRLGTDRSPYMPGILDLANPEHRALHETRRAEAKAKAQAAANREQDKRERALSEPTSTAAPRWRPLPTRDAGILNGLPVATEVGCDYLTRAHQPDNAVCCPNKARWFDPTTGLRVCTRHKKPASN